MGVANWVRIANDFKQSYEFLEEFVVLHGTDTLCYTASALPFIFENIGKTVIVTGSQIPIFETRTDGKDNFTSALSMAGNYVIPVVCVFLNIQQFRGNRTIKGSIGSWDAFNSPNDASLAKIRINCLQPPMRGVVLLTYGAGNLMTNRPDLLGALRDSANREVLSALTAICTKPFRTSKSYPDSK